MTPREKFDAAVKINDDKMWAKHHEKYGDLCSKVDSCLRGNIHSWGHEACADLTRESFLAMYDALQRYSQHKLWFDGLEITNIFVHDARDALALADKLLKGAE